MLSAKKENPPIIILDDTDSEDATEPENLKMSRKKEPQTRQVTTDSSVAGPSDQIRHVTSSLEGTPNIAGTLENTVASTVASQSDQEQEVTSSLEDISYSQSSPLPEPDPEVTSPSDEYSPEYEVLYPHDQPFQATSSLQGNFNIKDSPVYSQDPDVAGPSGQQGISICNLGGNFDNEGTPGNELFSGMAGPSDRSRSQSPKYTIILDDFESNQPVINLSEESSRESVPDENNDRWIQSLGGGPLGVVPPIELPRLDTPPLGYRRDGSRLLETPPGSPPYAKKPRSDD